MYELCAMLERYGQRPSQRRGIPDGVAALAFDLTLERAARHYEYAMNEAARFSAGG